MLFWTARFMSAITEFTPCSHGTLAGERRSGSSAAAGRFPAITPATAEHMWQALAWEANARVAMAELDPTRAQDCIAKGSSAMEGPLRQTFLPAPPVRKISGGGETPGAGRQRSLPQTARWTAFFDYNLVEMWIRSN